jgi:hypothetical protein
MIGRPSSGDPLRTYGSTTARGWPSCRSNFQSREPALEVIDQVEQVTGLIQTVSPSGTHWEQDASIHRMPDGQPGRLVGATRDLVRFGDIDSRFRRERSDELCRLRIVGVGYVLALAIALQLLDLASETSGLFPCRTRSLGEGSKPNVHSLTVVLPIRGQPLHVSLLVGREDEADRWNVVRS